MAEAEAEEPPSKRRRGPEDSPDSSSVKSPRYEAAAADMEMSPEPGMELGAGKQETGGCASAPDPDDVKLRNRRELCSLYRVYRSLKSCLGRHPTMGQELDELEKAYFTLLELANGCTSVRRIAAVLIPRYAVFCPTALDSASRVILQICEWTSSALMQGQDCNTSISETAEACFAGLVELCMAANTAARNFLGLRKMCAGVFHSLASYLLCELRGGALLCSSASSESADISNTLIPRTLSELFRCDPENVLASCFKLLQSSDLEQRRHGHHFLDQILLIPHQDGAMLPETEASFFQKIVHPKASLERRIVSMVRTFRTLEEPQVVENALPDLLRLLKALHTFSPADLELTPPQPPPAPAPAPLPLPVLPRSAEEAMRSPEELARAARRNEDNYLANVRAARTGKITIKIDSWSKEKRETPRTLGTGTDGEPGYVNSEDAAWASSWRDGRSSTLSSPLMSSPNQGPVSWNRDGDPAAMDVYAASEHLWVGNLGAAVTESVLRTEFRRFGQLEGAMLLREQGFAIVEYKFLRDAVEARQEMQGSTIWGKPVRIKFLDPALGSRGTLGRTAIGGSRYAWVGKVSSQVAKEELLKDLANAGFKPPLSASSFVLSRAVVLEFETPDDAAGVMLHIRQKRKEACTRGERSCGETGNRHLWVGKIDASVPEEEILYAFSQYGEVTGWKFLRQSSCCFIDFRSPECAAAARSRLNGTRFGSQAIVVEFKNNLQRNSPSSFYSPSRGPLKAGGSSLGTPLDNSYGKFSPPVVTPKRGSSSNSRLSGREPTNTLVIGLPETVSPSYFSEGQLRSKLNAAANGSGSVVRVRSSWTSRGPCRLVEFDGMDAAAMALQNASSYVDLATYIDFTSAPADVPFGYDAVRRNWDDDFCSPAQEGESSYRRQEGVCSPSPQPAPHASVPPGFAQASRASSSSCWQSPISPSPATVPRGPSRRPSLSEVRTASPPPPLPCEAPPPPPPPPPPPSSPSPPPPAPDAPQVQVWRGPLCKSGMQYCEVLVSLQYCSASEYDGKTHEPAGWPDKLDVTKRADLKSVRQLFNACAKNKREVCRLHTSTPEDEGSSSGFLKFMEYLKQRDRAGVVKLPESQGLWPRLLYILPWSAEASALLSVPPKADSLLCVVLPAPP